MRSATTRVPNPYRPGFNQAPLELAGRDEVLAAIGEAQEVAALDARTPRPVVLTGGRGVGKTVLLGEAAAMAAERYSWLTVPVEIRAGRSFLPVLVERLDATRDLYRQATTSGRRLQLTGARVRASVLGVGAEVELRGRTTRPPAPPRTLEAAMTEAASAALEHGAGLVLTIDELQLATRDELGELAAVLQLHVPDHWPLVVVLAGLPSIRDAHKGVTYLERGEWHVLGLLQPQATRRALQGPADAAGRPMSAPAAAALARASGGYPFAIQVMGHHAWRASTGSPQIEAGHAATAVAAAERELSAGLYASRWQDASPKERDYLAAMATVMADEGVATGAAVAGALGASTRAVSYLRERLLQKGTIFADNGQLAFAVPGMAEWILSAAPRR